MQPQFPTNYVISHIRSSKPRNKETFFHSPRLSRCQNITIVISRVSSDIYVNSNVHSPNFSSYYANTKRSNADENVSKLKRSIWAAFDAILWTLFVRTERLVRRVIYPRVRRTPWRRRAVARWLNKHEKERREKESGKVKGERER